MSDLYPMEVNLTVGDLGLVSEHCPWVVSHDEFCAAWDKAESADDLNTGDAAARITRSVASWLFAVNQLQRARGRQQKTADTLNCRGEREMQHEIEAVMDKIAAAVEPLADDIWDRRGHQ